MGDIKYFPKTANQHIIDYYLLLERVKNLTLSKAETEVFDSTLDTLFSLSRAAEQAFVQGKSIYNDHTQRMNAKLSIHTRNPAYSHERFWLYVAKRQCDKWGHTTIESDKEKFIQSLMSERPL